MALGARVGQWQRRSERIGRLKTLLQREATMAQREENQARIRDRQTGTRLQGPFPSLAEKISAASWRRPGSIAPEPRPILGPPDSANPILRRQASDLLRGTPYATDQYTTPEERERLISAGPDVVRQLIEQGNVGPVSDIGSPARASGSLRELISGGPRTLLDEEPLPGLAGRFLGGPAGAVSTLGTAGLGSFGSLGARAGVGVGGIVGGPLGSEAGAAIDPRLALPGGIAGGLAGGLAGGVAGAKGQVAAGITARRGLENAPESIAALRRNPEFGGTEIGANEPPKPLNAGSSNPVAKVWNFMLSSPGDEKGWVQSFRRMRGELEHQGTVGRVERRRLEQGAKKSGLRLTHERTPENERILALMEGVEVPEATAAERALAQELRGALDTETQAMIAADPSFSARALDDYVPRMFKDVEPTTAKGTTPQSRQRPFFLKGRTQPGTTLEVLDRLPNKDLVTWNPIDLVQLRINRGIQWRAEQQFLDALESQGLAMPRSQAPADWVVPDSPLFKGTAFMRLHSSKGIPPEEMAARFRAKAERLSAAAEKMDFSDAELVGGREVADDIAVPKDAAKFIDDMIGKRSAFNTEVPGQVIKKGSQGLKTIKVLGGLFQYFDYSYRTLASGLGSGIPIGPGGLKRMKYAVQSVPAIARSWARGFVPALDAKMLKYDLADPVRSKLLKEGLQVEGGLDIMEREIGDILKEPGFLARNGVTDKVATKRAKAVADYLTSGSYGRAHREFLLSHAEMLTDDFMRRGMSLEDAAARAVRQTHEQFSSLPAWQSVFRAPTTRDAMRIILFAPNEAEGWTRNYFRMFQPKYAEQAGRFWAGIAITTLAAANAIHYVSTGNLLPGDRYNPVNTERKGTLGFPISYNTTFMRPDLPWKGPLGRDLYLDLLGQGDTVLRFAFDPAFSAKTRFNVLPTTAMELQPALQGQTPRNFSGEPISGGNVLEYGLEKVAPIPAGSFLDEAERIGVPGAAVQASGWNISSQPLDQLVAEKYKEITGEDYNPEVNNEYARTLEPLKPIFAEIDKRRLARGQESAIQRKERSEFLAEQEQSLGIPEMARSFNSGNTKVGPQLISAYEDYSTALAIATARDLYGNKFADPDSKEGQALRAWQDITPQDFADPETFVPEWDEYYAAKDAAYAVLPESYRQTYEARLRLSDPSAREVEPLIKQAKSLQNDYYNIQKWLPAIEGQEEIKDVHRGITELRREAANQGKTNVPSEVLYASYKYRHPEIDGRIVDRAYKIRPGTRASSDLMNPERVDFLRQYRDILEPFFPELYTTGVLAELAGAR